MAFFKTRKPRQFEYKPRFYDPKKEELECSKARFLSIEENHIIEELILEKQLYRIIE